MYNVIIDNGVSYLFLENGTNRFDTTTMSGFLMNNDNIINLMNSLPVNRFFVIQSGKESMEITREQAYYLYRKLIDYNKNKKAGKTACSVI